MTFIAGCGRYFTYQRKHFLYANDKLYEGTLLSTSHIKLFPKRQNYQTRKRDHNARGKALG